PAICPRTLTLTEPDGHEEALARSVYLARVVALVLRNRPDCDHAVDQWARQPVSKRSVLAIFASPYTTSLRALGVESCRLTAALLAHLRDSPLALRLEELRIGVRLGDETDANLRATPDTSGDLVRDEIDRFLAEYGHRMVIWPPADLNFPTQGPAEIPG